jgi:hypothetical protein
MRCHGYDLRWCRFKPSSGQLAAIDSFITSMDLVQTDHKGRKFELLKPSETFNPLLARMNELMKARFTSAHYIPHPPASHHHYAVLCCAGAGIGPGRAAAARAPRRGRGLKHTPRAGAQGTSFSVYLSHRCYYLSLPLLQHPKAVEGLKETFGGVLKPHPKSKLMEGKRFIRVAGEAAAAADAVKAEGKPGKKAKKGAAAAGT